MLASLPRTAPEPEAPPMWPEGSFGQSVAVAGCGWHVARFEATGEPKLLMLHGTGASVHSFGPLARHLAGRFDMLAVDLPGQGRSRMASGCRPGLASFARAILELLRTVDYRPDYLVAHSAGVAIALEACVHQRLAIRRIFGINGALKPMPFNSIFTPMARFLAAVPMTSTFLAWQGRNGGADNLLANTGSDIPRESRDVYARLFAEPDHIGSTLSMMANWDLSRLDADLMRLDTPTTLIAALDDPMVRASVSREAAERMKHGEFVALKSGGHLVHESHPEAIAAIILERLDREQTR